MIYIRRTLSDWQEKVRIVKCILFCRLLLIFSKKWFIKCIMIVQSNVNMVSFNIIFIWLKRKESELSELLETLIISFSVYLFIKTTINNIFPAIFKMYKYVIQLIISVHHAKVHQIPFNNVRNNFIFWLIYSIFVLHSAILIWSCFIISTLMRKFISPLQMRVLISG